MRKKNLFVAKKDFSSEMEVIFLLSLKLAELFNSHLPY